jgi:hypothetical protein
LVEARIPVLVRHELERVKLGFHNIFSVIFTLIITGCFRTYTLMTFRQLSPVPIRHHLLAHFIEHVPQVVDLSFSEIELEEQFTPVTSFSEHEQSPINLGVDNRVDFDTGIPRAKAYALELA